MDRDNESHLREHKIVEALVKELRINAGLRQIDIATALGVQQSMISKYEIGERRLDILEIRKICQICQFSLEDFIKELEVRLRSNHETY